MTTKERIKYLVEEVAWFVAGYFNILDSDDVTDSHVEFSYGLLHLREEDILPVEMNTDRHKVKQAIVDAVDEWNTAQSYPEYEYAYDTEVAA